MNSSQSRSQSATVFQRTAEFLLEEADGQRSRRQRQTIEANTRFPRCAGGHIVEQYRADLAAIGFDVEGSHDRLRSTNRTHFDDHAMSDGAFATEHDQMKLKGVHCTRGTVLENERKSAVILLHALGRIELNAERWVARGDGCNTQQQQHEPQAIYRSDAGSILNASGPLRHSC